MSNQADDFETGAGNVALAGRVAPTGGATWSDPSSEFKTATDGSGHIVAYDAGATNGAAAWLDCGATDHQMEAEVTRNDGDCSVTTRLTDANNYYLFRQLTGGTSDLFSKVAGSFTSKGSGPSGFTPGVGAKFSLKSVGSTHTPYLGTTPGTPFTDSTLTTGTKGGIRSGASPFSFVNSVTITDLTASGTTVTADCPTPGEWLATARRDAPSPAEYLASLARDALAPGEALASATRDAVTPAEWLATAQGTSPSPTEWLGATVVTLDAGCPLEWLTTIQADRPAPAEALAILRGDQPTPAEWLAALARDAATPAESLTGRATDWPAPGEALATARRDTPAPAEWTGAISVTVDVGCPIEWTAGVLRDTVSPAEALASVRVDRPAPAEWLASVPRDVAAPAEWIAVVRVDARALTEWTGITPVITIPPTAPPAYWLDLIAVAYWSDTVPVARWWNPEDV